MISDDKNQYVVCRSADIQDIVYKLFKHANLSNFEVVTNV